MLRSLIIVLLLLCSSSLYAQINFKGYVIGQALPSNKVSDTNLSFGGQYGHLISGKNDEGVIYSLSFVPEKSGTPKLLTKSEVQKFVTSLKHYFHVKLSREARGEDGTFTGVNNGCKFIVNYKHQQFNHGSFYHIDLVIYNPKLGAI
ncbi:MULTISPECIES: hypothetical protein [Flammeovirga]|uniref:Uncharacterized protein n=1 Tax=Flammeovirga agarivorans TaxID=2726742 RepID=A0A7X8XW87_9BACT|nr:MULTISPECIES: hypothetical protein [Flammeovirga]NLR92088.1 hypothetical protein [Flammeovirga agarivorans]